MLLSILYSKHCFILITKNTFLQLGIDHCHFFEKRLFRLKNDEEKNVKTKWSIFKTIVFEKDRSP